ncbi:coagulation factor IXa [Takifugu rubripes]|uniref:Coagulation factor IX n=1 Tax=Takifugu rubripes TaxID=31033 RepID=A0A3B5KMJ6_TAKRU|nr:coagulation factor IX [Takifugu rubripes]
MDLFWLPFSCLLLVALQLDYSASGPAPLFLPAEVAGSVLQRPKRANIGVFEEWLEGNLERECLEETCDLEEVREVFEDDEKTMAFWMGYIDGNQCDSNPCLNQGSCEDLLGSYTCTCLPGFAGKDCEIVIAKRCDVNNGDCAHFCEPLGAFGAKCSCATGYRVTDDGLDCQPETEFPCGKTALMQVNSAFRRTLLGRLDSSLENDTAPDNVSTSPWPPSTPATTPAPFLLYNISADDKSGETNDTTLPGDEEPEPYRRIVGGDLVIPGEIPWQVALMQRSTGEVFCGGSILSERWVITAAHCLLEEKVSFYIRVGEHTLSIQEGTEQNYDVLEQHLHPLYNASISLYDHDIALIYLKSPIAFSANVRPICIGPRAFTEFLIKSYSPARVSGWGRTRYLGLTADSLQKVDVPFTIRTECKHSSSNRITPYMFCAGYKDEAKDACQGDSGGPHTNSIRDTWFLTGIVSWGEECAKEGKYGVYTRVSLYYHWIKYVMGSTKKRLAFDVENPDE